MFIRILVTTYQITKYHIGNPEGNTKLRQLGIEVMTLVRRARSRPSEAHPGLYEATGRLAEAPPHKTVGPILQPSVHLPVAWQGPDMPRPPLRRRRARSQHTHLQSEQQTCCNFKQKGWSTITYSGSFSGATANTIILCTVHNNASFLFLQPRRFLNSIFPSDVGKERFLLS